MPAANLKNTITIAISVSDRHASADWYRDMLGFELLFHADEVGWSELRTNTAGVTLGLNQNAEQTVGSTVPVFGIDDLDRARAGMEAAGAAFDGPTETIEGMVKLAVFQDMDGNKFMLAEDLSGAE